MENYHISLLILGIWSVAQLPSDSALTLRNHAHEQIHSVSEAPVHFSWMDRTVVHVVVVFVTFKYVHLLHFGM